VFRSLMGNGLGYPCWFFLGFYGLALAFPLYTACVLRGALRFH
jgi:hypothetical protein